MCGIAGYFGAEAPKDGERILSAMAGSLRHRGPDDQGSWQSPDGRVGLAHRRLSIIDLSPAGHQPMHDARGRRTISFNGEIYNFRELRTELEALGHEFRTASDTEVILAVYAQWGTTGFSRLSGMFAFAIFDAEEESLILVRDLAGKKPLYWTEQKGTLVFGSELKALRQHPALSFEIDSRSLAHYLSREYVPTPRTIFKDLFKLSPGTALKIRGRGITIEAWGTLCVEQEHYTETEALGRFDTLLSRATEKRLIADVPLGIFLSGGIDSSTVAYYAARAAGRKVQTFSIGFDASTFDESLYARLVAEHLGTDHHEKILSAEDALTLISEIPAVFDEPVADASVLPTMLLSQFTRQQVTVALGGDGADELLLGYSTFRAERMSRTWGRIPSPLRTLSQRAIRHLPARYGYLGAAFVAQKFTEDWDEDVAVRHLQWLGSFREDELQKLLMPQYRSAASGITKELIEDRYAECASFEGDAKLSHLYARTYLLDQVLVKVDRASMHYGLEVRAPFLDSDCMRFMLSLPLELKFRAGRGKYLLRTLMRGRLPNEVLERKKQGFAVPLASWLAGPLRPLMLDLLSPARLRGQGIFDVAEVERLVAEHIEHRRDWRKKLWTLLVFQLWYDAWQK